MTFMRVVLVLTVLLVLAGAFALKEYRDHEAALLAPMPLTGEVIFEVPSGHNVRRVVADMAERGWVASPRFFALYARIEKTEVGIKAGTYALTPGMSVLDAVALFVSGREIQHPFTIVEGWNFRDLRRALAADSRLEQTLGELDGAAIMQALGRPQRHPEGVFLADTYLFAPGAKDRDVLARALAAMDGVLQATWDARAENLPLASPYEALILASIIEKETAQARERPLISGVFVERLRRNMLLQTDPTVIYGIGESFDGNIRRKDLRTDTPYNTYTRKGLPPTPIAMVGREALHAAVNPEVDGSLYFVSRGDGTHKFSRTYKEHRRAVRKYQLGGRAASRRGGS